MRSAASTIGVLLTRGRPTEVYPEAILTFRTQEPLTISTDRSSLAFVLVRQEDYAPDTAPRPPGLARRPGYGGGVGVVIVSRGRRW